jgi:beta-mannosidase
MVSALCLVTAFVSTAVPNLPQKLDLGGAWTLTQADRKISVPALVPGIVQTDLVRAGLIPDPFIRDNETKVQWVGEVPWSYSRNFIASSELLHRQHVILRCEGLDTLARIRVNGQEVARPNNMFRTWEFDLKRILRVGLNQIQVDFEPIEPFLKAHENQDKFPGKPVQSHGWGYVRKPPFEQGWDFSPKIISSGIWRKIGLVAWNEARLQDVAINQEHLTSGQVRLHLKVAAETSIQAIAHTTVSFQGHLVAQADEKFTGSEAKTELAINQPHLWWPNGMGRQDMYDVEVDVRTIHGLKLDSQSYRIGLRTIKWFAKTEKSQLTLSVNGRRFFAKGSNWVPRDSLITRTTPGQEQQMVENAVAAHMNLMRLWGGGFYESDAFYNACDEKGLLVWFEFKFADATYPSFDSEWLANVRAEASDNVRRVRNHPSIAIFSGNNEVIGFIADKTDAGHMSRDDYNLLFHKTLAETVKSLDPNAAFTPGSPEIGDDHDWDVWHGSSSFASYRKVHGFLSEYGFQAFPVPLSVRSFTNSVDRESVLSPVMKFHQRNWRDGNQLILSTLLHSYRRPKDFDSTLWLSQIQQAAGVLTGVEHWRRDWPNSTGSLVWQFNDCWPSISWSMIDYFGRPKALYYNLKHAYAPVSLSGLTDVSTGQVDLWVVNDRPQAKVGVIDWRIFTTKGTMVDIGKTLVQIPAGTSSLHALRVNKLDAIKKYGAENLIVRATLRVMDEPLASTTLTFVRPKELSLEPPAFSYNVASSNDGFDISVKSRSPALWTWLDFGSVDARISDNFFDVLPGESVTVRVVPVRKMTRAQFVQSLKVRSLQDTYAVGTEPSPITATDVDGRIIATADKAEIVGDGAILEAGPPGNIGNWTIPSDYLQWTISGAKPGKYRVVAEMAIPSSEGGSSFLVEVQGNTVSGTVPGTNGWTDYKEVELGTIEISDGGQIHMLLRPTKMAHEHVMNLRKVILSPVH